MPTSGLSAIRNPAIVGQAEKDHSTVLKRLLGDTTLDEQQWVTLQFAAGAGHWSAGRRGNDGFLLLCVRGVPAVER